MTRKIKGSIQLNPGTEPVSPVEGTILGRAEKPTHNWNLIEMFVLGTVGTNDIDTSVGNIKIFGYKK